MENNNRNLVTIIIILVVCLIGLCSYIVYDTKFNNPANNSEVKDSKEENNTKKDETSKSDNEEILPAEKNIICSADIDILKGYKYNITYENNFLRYKIVNPKNKILFETHTYDHLYEKNVKEFNNNCNEYKFIEVRGEDDNYKYFAVTNGHNFYSVYSIKDDEVKKLTDVHEYYRTEFVDGTTGKKIDAIRVEYGILYIITAYDEEPAEFKYFFNNGTYGRVKTAKISYVGVAGAK